MLTFEEFVPFSNGDAWDRWQEVNCDRCARGEARDADDLRTCPIIVAIEWSQWGEPLTREMAERMGYVNQQGEEADMPWRCSEFEEMAACAKN